MPIQTARLPCGHFELEPFEQLAQLGRAFSLFFTSAFEKTDEAFEKVLVSKRDEQGRLIVYKDAKTKKDFTRVSYIVEKKTGDLYKDEEQFVVRGKCFALALANPLYTFGTMAWHVGKLPFVIGSLALRTLQNKTVKEMTAPNMPGRNIIENISAVLSRSVREVASAVFEVAKAPLFGLGVELAALYGIFKPYQARKIEALMENAWQKGASHRDDFRNIPAREGETCLQAFIKDVWLRKPLHEAHCFLIRGNLADGGIVLISRKPLTAR